MQVPHTGTSTVDAGARAVDEEEVWDAETCASDEPIRWDRMLQDLRFCRTFHGRTKVSSKSSDLRRRLEGNLVRAVARSMGWKQSIPFSDEWIPKGNAAERRWAPVLALVEPKPETLHPKR